MSPACRPRRCGCSTQLYPQLAASKRSHAIALGPAHPHPVLPLYPGAIVLIPSAHALTPLAFLLTAAPFRGSSAPLPIVICHVISQPTSLHAPNSQSNIIASIVIPAS
ncbi:hypothetical protein BD779DRAFT_1475064 [Infundibulicybe gibba]|nr:hypothetical protein BD779DRAFT_1475064 [Infundibulicybe gibba]